MMLDQAFAFAIILGTMGLLIWGRIRYDLVALLALLTSSGLRHRETGPGIQWF